jgi:hypothetical protein
MGPAAELGTAVRPSPAHMPFARPTAVAVRHRCRGGAPGPAGGSTCSATPRRRLPLRQRPAFMSRHSTSPTETILCTGRAVEWLGNSPPGGLNERREGCSAESAVRRDTFCGTFAAPLRLNSEQGRPHARSPRRKYPSRPVLRVFRVRAASRDPVAGEVTAFGVAGLQARMQTDRVRRQPAWAMADRQVE